MSEASDELTAISLDRVRTEITRTLGTLTAMGAHIVARNFAATAVEQGLWENPMQRPVQYLPGLPAIALHDPSAFWFVAHLERHYARIRAELDAVLAAGGPTGTAVDENLTASGRWEQVVFYDGGERFDPACSRFPVLAKAMAAIPEATTQGPGAVCLSWLYPGTHVKPHCGRSNAYLRVHLGLRVPGLARMRVGSQTVTWQEGGCLVFDDSFEHEVWNDGDEPRVVLLFDVWHPALSAHRRTALAGLRPNIHDKILAFMVERNLTRIETHADDLRLVPNDRLTGLIRRYMEQTRADAVELRDGTLHFARRP